MRENRKVKRLALLLASVAARIADTPEAQGALFDALHRNSRLVTFLRGHTGFLKSLAFSPDGKTLVSCGDDGSVLFWEVGERGLAAQPVSGRVAEKNARIVAFSRDGGVLAAGPKTASSGCGA